MMHWEIHFCRQSKRFKMWDLISHRAVAVVIPEILIRFLPFCQISRHVLHLPKKKKIVFVLFTNFVFVLSVFIHSSSFIPATFICLHPDFFSFVSCCHCLLPLVLSYTSTWTWTWIFPTGVSFGHLLSLYAFALKEGISPLPLSLLPQNHSDRGRVSIHFPATPQMSLLRACLWVYLLYIQYVSFLLLVLLLWTYNPNSKKAVTLRKT